MSLNFNKESWPAFLNRTSSISSTSDTQSFVDHVVQDLNHFRINPLQQRLASSSVDTPHALQRSSDQTMESSTQHRIDPISAHIMEETYDKEVRQLLSVLRESSLWSIVNASLSKIQPPSTHSAYPPALEYTLFLMALFQNGTAPSSVKGVARQLGSHAELDPQLQKQIGFLLDQMASLEKCCSKENACACAGQGLSDVKCR